MLHFIKYLHTYITEQCSDNDKDDESDEQTGSDNLLNKSKKRGGKRKLVHGQSELI